MEDDDAQVVNNNNDAAASSQVIIPGLGLPPVEAHVKLEPMDVDDIQDVATAAIPNTSTSSLVQANSGSSSSSSAYPAASPNTLLGQAQATVQKPEFWMVAIFRFFLELFIHFESICYHIFSVGS